MKRIVTERGYVIAVMGLMGLEFGVEVHRTEDEALAAIRRRASATAWPNRYIIVPVTDVWTGQESGEQHAGPPPADIAERRVQEPRSG